MLFDGRNMLISLRRTTRTRNRCRPRWNYDVSLRMPISYNAWCERHGFVHLAAIAEHGRIAWQRSSGYSRRSLVETAMYRYKTAGVFTLEF